MSNQAGNTIANLAIIIAIIGFFFLNIILGSIATFLGLIGLLASPSKQLNWIAIGLGLVAVIIGLI